MSGPQTRITRIDRLDLRVEADGWPEAERHRAEIDAAFAALSAENPHVWNGRVFLLRQHEIVGGVFSGTCIETDFAAFNWWRKRGVDDLGVKNIFAFAAVEGADGGFVMGVMGDHTAAAGKIYFAGGTPDPQDARDGYLDLRGSALREMTEETGLSPEGAAESEGWDLCEQGFYLCLMRRVRFARPAPALAEEARAFLAREALPELKAIHMVASEADLAPDILPYVASYVRWRWAGN